jgi:hypothetical protein
MKRTPHPAQPDIHLFHSYDRSIFFDDATGSFSCRLATRRPLRLVLDQNRPGLAPGYVLQSLPNLPTLPANRQRAVIECRRQPD